MNVSKKWMWRHGNVHNSSYEDEGGTLRDTASYYELKVVDEQGNYDSDDKEDD